MRKIVVVGALGVFLAGCSSPQDNQGAIAFFSALQGAGAAMQAASPPPQPVYAAPAPAMPLTPLQAPVQCHTVYISGFAHTQCY